jgi:hypothetical protein
LAKLFFPKQRLKSKIREHTTAPTCENFRYPFN